MLYSIEHELKVVPCRELPRSHFIVMQIHDHGKIDKIKASPNVCDVLFSRNSRARVAVTDLFRDYGLVLRPEIELGSVDLLIEFARKGLGISFVTREFVAQELEEGSLFEIKLNVNLPPSQVGFMTLRNMPLPDLFSNDGA